MNRKESIKFLILLFLACSLIATWFVIYPVTRRHIQRAHPYRFDFYICLYPYSYNNMQPLNLTDFYRQVDKAKEIGAVGIELFNVPCFYDEGYLDDALDYIIKTKKMKVILFLEYFNRSCSFPFPKEAWDKSGFPDNDHDVNLYCEYLENVSKIARKYCDLSYAIVYPFNSSETNVWVEKIKTSKYRVRCQDLVYSIRKWDRKPVYMLVELWQRHPFEIYGMLPLNLDEINGYGWMGYNLHKDQIDENLLLGLRNYFDQFGDRKQFVAEFGFRTKGELTHGYASNEAKKCELIERFLGLVRDWDMPVCYFGLTDFPPENADYGLVDDQYNLKPCGKTLENWLRENKQLL